MIRHYSVLYSQGISIVVAETSEKFGEGEETVQRPNGILNLPTLSSVWLDFHICMFITCPYTEYINVSWMPG